MTKLSINIDMGAKNNGVFVAKIKDDKIISKAVYPAISGNEKRSVPYFEWERKKLRGGSMSPLFFIN